MFLARASNAREYLAMVYAVDLAQGVWASQGVIVQDSGYSLTSNSTSRRRPQRKRVFPGPGFGCSAGFQPASSRQDGGATFKIGPYPVAASRAGAVVTRLRPPRFDSY